MNSSSSSTPVLIRNCRLEEAADLLVLWREAGATPSPTDTLADIERMIALRAVYGAQIGERIVGSLIGAFDGWRANMYRLAVHPSYRRQGIARALVAKVESSLIEQGAKRIGALVETDHPRATAFWQAVGYTPSPQMARYVRNV